MRQRQTGKQHVRRKPNVRPAREEGRAALLTPPLIRMQCGVNTLNSADPGLWAARSAVGQREFAAGPLCKLIDNLRGSDKIPARVHGRAISARPCQHNQVRSGGLEKKFTPPFFFLGRLCFSRSIKGQTHTQTHAGPSLGP